MTYSEWLRETFPEWRSGVEDETASLLYEKGYIPQPLFIDEIIPDEPQRQIGIIRSRVREVLSNLNYHFNNRTLLATPSEFSSRLVIILSEVLPEFFNQLYKYQHMTKYYSEQTFGHETINTNISASGTLPISTVQEEFDEFNANSHIVNGYEKSQDNDKSRSVDFQEVVRRNIAFSGFWRLNIFSMIISRVEHLFVRTIVHEW